MIVDRDIQSVMFTGSVGIGKRVVELCSRNLTNVTLELGGKDPMVVLEDADIERAARGAVWTAFMNCGQSCGSIERVYVARKVAEAFTARVVELAKQVRVGNPARDGRRHGTDGQRRPAQGRRGAHRRRAGQGRRRSPSGAGASPAWPGISSSRPS